MKDDSYKIKSNNKKNLLFCQLNPIIYRLQQTVYSWEKSGSLPYKKNQRTTIDDPTTVIEPSWLDREQESIPDIKLDFKGGYPSL